MAKLMASAALILAATSASFSLERSAFAQAAVPPASAAFPPPPNEAAPAATPAAVAPLTPAPAPLPAPPAAAPVYAQPQPYAPPYPAEPPPPSPYAYPSGEPPPPPRNPDDGFKVPEISVRVDPFNLLLEGRLELEVETQLYKFLTLELVPVFVTTKSPPTLNYDSYEKSTLHQASNGLGAMSGAAVDAGLWFGGKAFEGYVLRAGFTNYAYTYETTFEQGGVDAHDSVSHTDRQFFAMIGTHNRWGAFTIAGGIGLAYELNQQNRCFKDDALMTPTSDCKQDGLNIKLDSSGNYYDLHSFLYPFDLLARFSLGVVF